MKLVRPFMVASACAAALALAACDNSANRDRSAAGTSGETAASKDQPVTLTGCLMKGDGRNDFILTKANEPVGTTGSAGSAATPAEKTLDAAEHSYRLDGNNDDLEKLVGHKIRVSGTIDDRGNLEKKSASERGTSGDVNKDREIKDSDLAKVDVKSVESIADSCDGGNSSRPSPSRR
jgi:hypothetical protein